jgi:hypothetical protein
VLKGALKRRRAEKPTTEGRRRAESEALKGLSVLRSEGEAEAC